MLTNSIFVNLKNLKTKMNERNRLLDMLTLLLQHYFEINTQKNVLQRRINFFLAIRKV